MSSKKIDPTYLALTSFVLGSMNLFLFYKAMNEGDLLTAFILTVTNFCVFFIGGVAAYRLKKQTDVS